MKNLTERGVIVFFSVIITLVILLSMTGCSSTAVTGCEDKIGVEKDECIRAKKAHEQMIRSGFYDRPGNR